MRGRGRSRRRTDLAAIRFAAEPASDFPSSMPSSEPASDFPSSMPSSEPAPLVPAIWNSADKSASITLTNGDLTADSGAYGFTGVRANLSKTAGKFYCEFSANAMDDNDSGIGVVLASASLGGLRKGGAGPIVYTTVIYSNFGGPGSVLTNIVGNTLCMAVDLDARKAWFRTNNGNWNGSPSDDPATGAGGIDYSSYISAGAAMMPGMAASTPNIGTTANFGASAYSYTPPSGYGNWEE